MPDTHRSILRRFHCWRLPALIFLLIGVTALALDVKNPGFEQWEGNRPFAWNVTTERAAVRVTERPGWYRLTRTFNTGPYHTVRVYVRMQSGTGAVWFDDVTLSDLPLRNPGFERSEGENRVEGWGQDNEGRTIFHDTTVARSGGASACIRQAKSGMSRLWQNVPCKPNSTLTLGVWARAVDSVHAYAEVYGIDEEGRLGQHWGTEQLGSAVCGTLAPDNQRALLFQVEDGGQAVVSQNLELPAGKLYTARCDLRFCDCEAQAVRLRALDARTKAVLGEGGIAAENVTPSAWSEVRLDFAVPDHGQIQLAVVVEGAAPWLEVDDASVNPFQPRFPIQQLSWREDVAALRWVQGKIPSAQLLDDLAVGHAWEILAEALGVRADGPVQEPGVRIRLTGPANAAWPECERYRMRVDVSGVTIEAATSVGVRWALVTLAGLGVREPDGGWRVDACAIEDWPDMPLRITYRGGFLLDAEKRGAFCQRLLGLRMNGVVMEDGRFFRIADPTVRSQLEETFADMRSYGLDPIPEMQSFGHAGNQIGRDLRTAEGEWVHGERLVLVGTEPVELKRRNVIRTTVTDVVLASEDAQTTYALGRDYDVLDGTLVRGRPDKAKPFAVRRTAVSRIPDGTAVLASYDVVAGGGTYCPSEPLVYEMCLPALREVIRTLKPRYVHIGHDEPQRMNADNRCIRRGLSETALIVEDLRRWRDAACEADPTVRLMMWADPLNPYHNGKRVLESPDDFANLPKDIIMNVWFYGANEPGDRGMKSLEFFAQRGITTTGSPWYGVACARDWARTGKAAREKGLPYLGAFYTSWSQRWSALEATAAGAWKTPE